jgi:sortase B
LSKVSEYRESDEHFREIRSGAITDYSEADALENLVDVEVESVDDVDLDVGLQPVVVTNAKDAIQIDWDAFEGTEIVAWFQMDDISYPVMQHSDNSYYLHRLPDGSYNYGGSLFLLSKNSPLFTDQSSFIYGHNMNNGSMFGSLRHYIKEEYRGHHFYLYLPDGTRHVYRFFSIGTVFQESKAYTYSFESEKTFLDWQEWMLEQSKIDTGEKVVPGARFVTLSTCNGVSGTNHRLVCCGIEERIEQLQQPAKWFGDYMNAYNDRSAEKVVRSRNIMDDLERLQSVNREVLWNEYTGVNTN